MNLLRLTEKEKSIAPLVVAMALLGGIMATVWDHFARADQVVTAPPSVQLQTMAACSLEGAPEHKIAVSGTSASTGPLGKGTFRVICDTDVHMKQSVAGATGATATSGNALMSQWAGEYFYSRGSWVAFIQDSAAGNCYVTECQ